ncbi:hypothetical protein HIM_09698 [Hirsutella minnesotensis 3608]|uniref:Uncharacterized protein n=1 Tax=Hirsutella minnesotensis 3608 TaxID=1043627 RepID=A0A0F7ZL30_9HYPO|nr:hypothetical protein HIM_09698 [Hirsutella minnesotensis 3608]
MADGIAIAIDKVGAPAPSAPEAKAGAPTVDTSGALNSPVKEDHPSLPEKPTNVADGAGSAVAAPKPVEVKSVPETPVNGATPAGGTPRPELKIVEEPSAASAATARLASPPANSSEGAAAIPSAPTEPAAGEKRKLGEGTVDDAAPPAAEAGSESPAKKAKVDQEAPAKVNGDAPVVENPPARKPGRPKKDKTAAAPVAPAMGRTARKTRSQGPAEV